MITFNADITVPKWSVSSKRRLVALRATGAEPPAGSLTTRSYQPPVNNDESFELGVHWLKHQGLSLRSI
ncbi:MAG TPA: hypothetical protein DDW62_00215 [Marinilabiliaceae bacterium]|nr:hypothetical protein [Marinilabiliaceae bacterium]